MKKRLLSIISFILASLMVLGILASCSSGGENETESSKKAETTDVESNDKTETSEKEGEETNDDGGNNGNGGNGGNSDVELVGPNAPIIELADNLKNNVSMYFNQEGSRDYVTYENMDMKLEYALDAILEQQVTSLTNKSGNPYIQNTMDVFVEMENGNTFYAKDSIKDTFPNIYRFGYYYYQMRLEGQNFVRETEETSSQKVQHTSIVSKHQIKSVKKNDGILYVTNEDSVNDAFIVFTQNISMDAEKYTVLEITMRADENTSSAIEVFYIAGGHTGFSEGQRVGVTIIPDGEVHTYKVPLYMGADYSGRLTGLRIDVGGNGANYEFHGLKLLEVDTKGAPTSISLNRDFNIYSDKMHHVIQIAATEETSGIKNVGMLTKIDVNTVNAVVLEDKDGIRYTFDGADWDSVQYIGFDIKDAGIFGYILPYDGRGGKLHVETVDGYYVIKQTMTPENGTIKPSRTDYNTEMGFYNWVAGGNTNDLYMGQRIYTDSNHSFDEFLAEAYCERHPLSEKNFKVNEESSSDAIYQGYDSLRGNYEFRLSGPQGGFSTPYYKTPNKHYKVNFVVRGDSYDRQVYVLTYTSVGELECAALLDGSDVMIPVPLEVGKNFSEISGERNIFNLADATYGEVIFPMVIESGEKYEYTVLNLYQNWGKYPLKQISWIQFFSPYYHLSTGVTETNCVLPWMFTDRTWYNTLPDHRGFSAPMWSTQPQHTSSGEHDWLRYVDTDGNVVRWENTWNTIDSYGPTYADVKMDYITYDGKMKVSYTHTEMPQTDENRAYYEMTYEVLDDITINNFVENFQLYKVDPNDPTGIYQKVGYLNEQNECVVVNANLTSEPVKYVLGDQCPYFSFFDMDNHKDGNGYGNVAFLIYNSEFIMGGEKVEPNFAILNYEDTVLLTLNIEEQVTLKKGDVFKINAIVLPWGSHQLEDGIIDPATNNYEYDMELPDGTLYMDKNVRDVRENSLLNPFKTVAGENCETVESVFVPKVKSTNGESAEFTITGGFGNVAIRVYGFNKATVPNIYEKVNGEWVKYEVSSADDEKYPHKYDGYCVHYDGDGTYSYSFVTTMDGKNDRTFKIVADGNYEKWGPETNKEVSRTDYLDVYIDPQEILDTSLEGMQKYSLLSGAEVILGTDPKELDSYIRIYGHPADANGLEGYASLYQAPANVPAGGKYLVLKYRLPETNTENVGLFEFFLSTSVKGPGDDVNGCRIAFPYVNNDGEWHTVIIDVSQAMGPTYKPSTHFVAADDGKYYPKFLRFDFFDKKMSETSCIDIGFIGFESDYEEILPLIWDSSTVRYYEGNEEFIVNPGTGDKVSITPKLPDVLVDPSSGYTLSDLEFGAQLDNINGKPVALESGSADTRGVACINYFGKSIADFGTANSATVEGTNIVLGGWCAVQGGVNKYVWSADGGKTWNSVSTYAQATYPYKANSEILKVGSGRTGGYTFVAGVDDKNGSFQGNSGNNPTGICLDLEAYKGKTVDIIFGAVPQAAQDTIVPLFFIGQVTVPNVE